MAAGYYSLAVAELLIRPGADVNAKDKVSIDSKLLFFLYQRVV